MEGYCNLAKEIFCKKARLMMCQAIAVTSMLDEIICDGPQPVSNNQVLLHQLMRMGDRLIV